ncbi:hypothetical protein G6662_01990 [Polynucleobacter paneuropaeus]|jgi:hypothetical protein|uniref:hypothetical protein n=1 Tax=Polynucleobacter paneuropaeus TaxID=2527775 RepID=UPI001BFD5134|nr:hypothetical protein [Polynucleobacter paneuropaeus]MBT8572353.1 hypothetical protein [Polynucleobacter paneuropaeus]MBT8603345.1 hypothetical protein [Polynucleobacter paneuropaeus]MBT8622790.1 hypothetical protein [Polynucleobacter paneuropaeus]
MEVINKNPLASDFAVLFQRIITLAKELDGMREYYRELYKKIESGELSVTDDQEIDLLKTFNVAGFVNLSIVSARAAQTAAIIANDVSLSRVFDPALKTTERALRHIESGAYR